MGELFSIGDEFIAQCAERAPTGNGLTWLWAKSVHHLTLASIKAAGPIVTHS